MDYTYTASNALKLQSLYGDISIRPKDGLGSLFVEGNMNVDGVLKINGVEVNPNSVAKFG